MFLQQIHTFLSSIVAFYVYFSCIVLLELRECALFYIHATNLHIFNQNCCVLCLFSILWPYVNEIEGAFS